MPELTPELIPDEPPPPELPLDELPLVRMLDDMLPSDVDPLLGLEPEPLDADGIESVVPLFPLFDGVCVVPGVLLVKAPVV